MLDKHTRNGLNGQPADASLYRQLANDGALAGPEIESDTELRALGWLPTEKGPVEYKPPIKLHRLPDWLAEDDLPDGWQLPLIAPAGAVTLLSADPKCGKTQLLLALMTAAYQGRPVMGVPMLAGLSVALLTEEKRPSIRRGLHRVGMDFDNLPVDWWVGSLWDKEVRPDWPNMADHLGGIWMEQGAPDLCVVDTIGRWADCDDWNSYSRVIEATAPLHELSNAFPHMAVVAIHHNKKSGGDIIAAASGSNALTGAADHIVSMSKVGSDEGDEFTRKLRFLSRFDVADETQLVRWDGVGCGYTLVQVGAGMRELILDVMAQNDTPLTIKAIQELLPCKDDGSLYDVGSIRARVNDAVARGQLNQAGKDGKSNLYVHP